jgi:hypothetical protein
MATVDFNQLIATLDSLISDAPRMPVTDLALVREQELVDVLAQMRANVGPSAEKAYAQRREIEAIRTRAVEWVEEMLLRAQDEVEGLVHDPHLQRDARKRADEVLTESRVKAESIRAAADDFFTSTLSTFNEHLEDLDIVLVRDIEALRESTQALRERTEAARLTHKIPLAPEKPLFVPGSIQKEYHEPSGQSKATPEPRGGPNAPTPKSPLQ